MTNIKISKPIDNTIVISINDYSFPCNYGFNTAIDLMNKMFEAMMLNQKFSIRYKIDEKEFSIEAADNIVVKTGDSKMEFSININELAEAMFASFKENASDWIQDEVEIDVYDMSEDIEEVCISETTGSNENMFYDELNFLEEAIQSKLIYHNKTSFDAKVRLAHFNMNQEKNA